MTRRRLIAVLSTSALAAGAIAAVTAALPASAASSDPVLDGTVTTSLVYSVDGGTTWTTKPSVAPGGQVLVRAYFSNATDANISNVALATALPAGFLHVAGSTAVCLNPGTTDVTQPSAELVCNTDTDQGGAIPDKVWTKQTLSISPSAGLFGNPDLTAANGTLYAGRARYLNLQECGYAAPSYYWSNLSSQGVGFTTGTNVSNTADTTPTCGAGHGTSTPVAGLSGVTAIDLLGHSVLHIDQCAYGTKHVYAADVKVGTAAYSSSSTRADNVFAFGTPTCGAGTKALPTAKYFTGRVATLLKRYVNIQSCAYSSATASLTNVGTLPVEPDPYNAYTTSTDTPGFTKACEPGDSTTGTLLFAKNSASQSFDTLDTTRSQGFVQWSMSAPKGVTVQRKLTQTSILALTATDYAKATGTITVKAALLK